MIGIGAIMDSIFASGTVCAAPIAALVTLFIAAPGAAEAPGAASLDVYITGVRSAKGVIRLAICPLGAMFPDCRDKAVRTAKVEIENGRAKANFVGLSPGTYGVSVFHDANLNGRLDTFMGIPNEGYGFSRNPSFRPRAPRFSEAAIVVEGSAVATISLRYLL